MTQKGHMKEHTDTTSTAKDDSVSCNWRIWSRCQEQGNKTFTLENAWVQFPKFRLW